MEQRQVEIFNRIYASDYPLKSTELSTILNVSDRTIRNDIKTLNDFSNEKGYKIVRVKNQGYKVQLIDTEKFYTYFISGSHRVPRSKINDVDWIIYLLVCTSDFVSIDELAEQTFSSRSKVVSTIDLVSKTVKNYSLNIDTKTGKGIKIIGDEESKRSFLHHLLNQHKLEQMSLDSTWYSKENYQCSLECIKEIAQQWGLHFTDENLELIAFHFLITFNRLSNESALKVKQLQIDQCEQDFCDCLFEAHEKLFRQVLPEQEKNYLASIILSKKDSPNKTNISDEEAFHVVQQFVQSINQKYGYDFAYFLEPDSDFFSHVKGMLYRMRKQLTLHNPLKNKIQREHPFAYEIALAASQGIIEISEDELSYLALYIGVALEQTSNIHSNIHEINCLLVCGSGKSTAIMLETTIQKYVKNIQIDTCISKKEYELIEKVEQDLVITSIEIEQKNAPVIYLSSIPSRPELKELKRNVSYFTNQKKDKVLNLFSSDQFSVRQNYQKTKEDLISERVNQLLDNQFVTDKTTFYSSLIERERLGNTAIGGGIAIPHPMEMQAEKSCIDVVILKEPMEWTFNETVSVIFLLSLNKEDYKESLAIYDYFLEIIYMGAVEQLTTIETFEDFKNFSRKIFKNIKDK